MLGLRVRGGLGLMPKLRAYVRFRSSLTLLPGTTEHQLGDGNPPWPGRNDARDKSRSLGFSPGTHVSSPLKSPVVFRG